MCTMSPFNQQGAWQFARRCNHTASARTSEANYVCNALFSTKQHNMFSDRLHIIGEVGKVDDVKD